MNRRCIGVVRLGHKAFRCPENGTIIHEGAKYCEAHRPPVEAQGSVAITLTRAQWLIVCGAMKLKFKDSDWAGGKVAIAAIHDLIVNNAALPDDLKVLE